jgi:hypothetical protein
MTQSYVTQGARQWTAAVGAISSPVQARLKRRDDEWLGRG